MISGPDFTTTESRKSRPGFPQRRADEARGVHRFFAAQLIGDNYFLPVSDN